MLLSDDGLGAVWANGYDGDGRTQEIFQESHVILECLWELAFVRETCHVSFPAWQLFIDGFHL